MMQPAHTVPPLPKPSKSRRRPRGYHVLILGDPARPTRRRYLSSTFVHALLFGGFLVLAALAGLGLTVTYQSHQATAWQAEVLALQNEREHLADLLASQDEAVKELALEARTLAERLEALESFASQMEAIVAANPDVMPEGRRIDLALERPVAATTVGAGGALPTDELLQWTATTLTTAIQTASAQDRKLSTLRSTLDKKVHRLQHTPSIWPVDGWVSSTFGYRQHPITGRRDHHDGIDIAAPQGTQVVATAAGTVVRAGWVQGYGYMVEIDHGYGLRTIYAHGQRVLVKRGQQVTKGEPVLLVGSTGVSTGPHLHYEVRLNGRPVSPWSYLP